MSRNARAITRFGLHLGLGALGVLLFNSPIWAQETAAAAAAAPPAIDTGDTAWVLTASALVLMMTLPGLALFYGG